MTPADYPCWPAYLPRTLSVPRTSLAANLEITARRHPDRAATVFYGATRTWREIAADVDALAGWLVRHCGVRRGDRVLIDGQNCPQFVIGYYAILRADAVVVPVSPMHVTDELAHHLEDSGARVAIAAADVAPRFAPLLGSHVDHLVTFRYADALPAQPGDLPVPAWISEPTPDVELAGATDLRIALLAQLAPRPVAAGADDLAAILYTSGTTGRAKGCMHTHATLMCTTVGAALWESITSESVILSTAPLFHVTGMQHSMNTAVWSGGTLVFLPRWDPAAAGALIERHGVTHWANVPTMVVDLLAHPSTAGRDLGSLVNVFGGGASMPEPVARELKARAGIEYMEAYGMTETISQTHMNPPGALRRQCLGIPTFDTDSRIVDPDTLEEVGPDTVGEIVSSGPQVMQGYWRHPEATQQAFITLDGRRFLRTGDLGRRDADGFFYIADRLKRMINAAGFKVWPAEVEATLFRHPAIQEACIIGVPDARRGETVRACVVLKPDWRGRVAADDIIAWSREHMAAYKIPREVEFLDALPRSGTGKVQWRALQEAAVAAALNPPR
ncbi:MAG: long-chain-fatty-acid--CoA ligase [Burkholderiales bacterium]|nr:long-chain-fatty-acid--CoA ligase [Burkholderiales bacterium]